MNAVHISLMRSHLVVDHMAQCSASRRGQDATTWYRAVPWPWPGEPHGRKQISTSPCDAALSWVGGKYCTLAWHACTAWYNVLSLYEPCRTSPRCGVSVEDGSRDQGMKLNQGRRWWHQRRVLSPGKSTHSPVIHVPCLRHGCFASDNVKFGDFQGRCHVPGCNV